MVFLGSCPEGERPHEVSPLHSNRMVLNESAMTTGIGLYAAVALAKSGPSISV